MDGALDFHPLRVFIASSEFGKVHAWRACGERSATEDTDLGAADHGTKATRGAYSPHIHQGSYKERVSRLASQLANHLDKDSAGGIVNEDGGLSGAEVRIEVGDDPLQVDGIGTPGLLVS
jgi:hypothetical protein